MIQEKILVVGANGQLGSVLTKKLQERYGMDAIVASDLNVKANFEGIFETLDATDYEAIKSIVEKYKVTQIYHLAAILSANGEKAPLRTWDINMQTFFNVLEAAKNCDVKKVFYPSSIAVFGNNIQRENTPQNSILNPSTVYGNSKVAGENWANYYYEKYGLDIRSLRYPGIIGYQSLPGGGTTDYAIDIFHKAINHETFECFLDGATKLPMIYMEDAIRATIELMEAPAENITLRTSYNLAGMSFTPQELYESIKENYPDFKIVYNPDYRQKIADSWPMSIDDSQAQKDFNWKPQYNLKTMTEDMIKNLESIKNINELACTHQ
ncbi:NAD-dependent epimerase/dehydratase family protein [Flavobacterium sp. MAHUQ-51]|uniref:NAD-dependent epimerase/dehydratase family protein n=1 Tax=Flavobacterium sp. GCM10022190 TaxID=3252639 RepID=UPI003607D4B3